MGTNGQYQPEFAFDYSKSEESVEVESIRDRNMICRKCKREFVWTKEQQEIDTRYGYDRPEYCDMCRLRIHIRNRKREH
jgi:hypothetical protein